MSDTDPLSILDAMLLALAVDRAIVKAEEAGEDPVDHLKTNFHAISKAVGAGRMAATLLEKETSPGEMIRRAMVTQRGAAAAKNAAEGRRLADRIVARQDRAAAQGEVAKAAESLARAERSLASLRRVEAPDEMSMTLCEGAVEAARGRLADAQARVAAMEPKS